MPMMRRLTALKNDLAISYLRHEIARASRKLIAADPAIRESWYAHAERIAFLNVRLRKRETAQRRMESS